MKRNLRRCCLVMLCALALPTHAGTPLAAYGRLPSIEEAALSPDGSKIAFIQTTQDWRMLVIADLEADTLVSSVRLGTVRVRTVEWADDDHLLLTTAYTGMPAGLIGTNIEWDLMTAYDLKTKKLTRLLDNVRSNETTMNVVYGRPVVQHTDAGTVIYVHGLYVRTSTTMALFRVNLTTGVETVVRQGSGSTNQWLVDDSGDVVAEQDYVENEHRWAIRLYDNGHRLQTVSGIAAIDTPDMLGLSPQGDAIIVALTEPDGVTWKQLSIKDGTWGADIAADESLSEVLLKSGSRRMIGNGLVGDTIRYHFSDPHLQEGWDWVERVFSHQRSEFVSTSADHSKILVRVLGPTAGYAYFLADIKEHLTRPIGAVYDGVTRIAEVRSITYPAADKLQIPAYLTLPPDRPAKNLPIIVFPHGGPQSRDRPGFDWWAQALAAQGYAVLQPNYRGSDLGSKWVQSGYGEWGRKMQTDLSDGLAYLAAQGIVDAKRACIVGASYGGYAALAGVSIQSGIYRCAVAVAGVSDPANIVRWVMRKESFGDKQGQRYWKRFLGVDDPGDARLTAISPLHHVAQITVPLMLIHGRDDTTVPYEQSADLAKALQRAGKSAEFITLDQEDHYLSRSATRLQMLQASLSFLAKYNPPD